MIQTETIFTYGGGEALYYIFNGIATLLGGGKDETTFSFNQLAKLACVIGMAWSMLIAITRNSPTYPVKWFIWFVVATEVFFLPKCTVMIYDRITGFEKPVANVPVAVGVVGSIISTIGDGLTREIETIFTLPDYQPYHQTGSVFASRIIADLGKFKIQDADFNSNISKFVNNCIVYEAMIGSKYTLNDLKNSEDIWKLVTDKASPILGFPYKDPLTKGSKAESVSCKVGAERLGKMWNKQYELVYGKFFTKYPSSDGKPAKAIGNDQLKKQFAARMGSSFKLLTKVSGQADDILKQELMINAIYDASHNKVGEFGGASYASTKALLQQRSTYNTLGELAPQILMVTKALFEALIYASFVFIMILSLLPNGITVLTTYFGLMMWIQMWPPLYAILNLVMTVYAQYRCDDLNLTLATSVGLANFNADMVANAGYIAAVGIPSLSYMIVKGGAAQFSHLAGHLSSGLQSAASHAASEVTSGNLSMANVSYGTNSLNNFSGFKHDTSAMHKSGQFETVLQDGTAMSNMADGSTVFKGGSGFTTSQGTRNVKFSDSISSQLSQNLSNEQSIMDSRSKEISSAETSAVRNTADFIDRLSKSESSGTSYDISKAANQDQHLKNAMSFNKVLQERLGVNSSQAADLVASVSAGGSMFGMSGNVGANFKNSNHYEQSLSQAMDIAKNTGYEETLSSLAKSAKDIRYGDNNSKEASLAEGMNASVDKASSLREAQSVSEQKVQRYSDALSYTKSSAFNVDTDLNQQFREYIADQPVNMGPNNAPGKVGMLTAHKIVERGGAEYESYLKAFESEVAGNIIQSGSNISSGGVGMKNNYSAKSSNMKSPVNNMDTIKDNVINFSSEAGLKESNIDRTVKDNVINNIDRNETQINEKQNLNQIYNNKQDKFDNKNKIPTKFGLTDKYLKDKVD